MANSYWIFVVSKLGESDIHERQYCELLLLMSCSSKSINLHTNGICV